MYIGPITPRGTNKNPNRVPDLLTKVLPKAASGLASKPWQEGLGTRQRLKSLIESEVMLERQGLTYTRLFWGWRPQQSAPGRLPVPIHLPRYRGKCRPAQRAGPTSTSDLPRPWFWSRRSPLKSRIFRILWCSTGFLMEGVSIYNRSRLWPPCGVLKKLLHSCPFLPQ